MSRLPRARRCALQIALLLLDAIAAPRPGAAAAPTESTRVVAGVPTDQELEALGAVIGDIYINNENIFNLDNPADNVGLFRLADKLHVRTRAGVIRNELLFRSGDRYSRRILDETERILRNNRYFYDAWILPVSYHDGVVDLRITTRDVWTFDPGFHFGRSGGANSTGVQLQELNFLGSGTNASVGHTSNVDRTQSSVGLSHPNLFGSWITGSAAYTSASDGLSRQFDLEQPFYSLETRHAYGANGLSYDQQDSLYDRGQVVEKFQDVAHSALTYAGFSQGLSNGWVQRFTVGGALDEHRFARLADFSNALLPEDRRFVYPFLGYQVLQDDYVRTMNHDQIARTEDFYLGTTFGAQVGYTTRGLSSTRQALLFQSNAGTGFGDVDHTLLLFSGTFNGRVEEHKLHDTILNSSARYYWKMGSHWLFYTAITGAKSWRLDLDHQILLGGDNGLRGYPLRFSDGTSSGLLTVEERYFTDWYLFRLLRVGGAVFFDAGRTWGQPVLAQPNPGLLKDVGLGLRFGNARSGLGNVVHVDLAFPLNAPPTVSKIQFLVDTQASF